MGAPENQAQDGRAMLPAMGTLVQVSQGALPAAPTQDRTASLGSQAPNVPEAAHPVPARHWRHLTLGKAPVASTSPWAAMLVARLGEVTASLLVPG